MTQKSALQPTMRRFKVKDGFAPAYVNHTALAEVLSQRY
jgi:hypothetical protein